MYGRVVVICVSGCLERGRQERKRGRLGSCHAAAGLQAPLCKPRPRVLLPRRLCEDCSRGGHAGVCNLDPDDGARARTAAATRTTTAATAGRARASRPRRAAATARASRRRTGSGRASRCSRAPGRWAWSWMRLCRLPGRWGLIWPWVYYWAVGVLLGRGYILLARGWRQWAVGNDKVKL